MLENIRNSEEELCANVEFFVQILHAECHIYCGIQTKFILKGIGSEDCSNILGFLAPIFHYYEQHQKNTKIITTIILTAKRVRIEIMPTSQLHVFFSSLTNLNPLRTSSTKCFFYIRKTLKIRTQVNGDIYFMRKKLSEIYWFAFSRLSLLSV